MTRREGDQYGEDPTKECLPHFFRFVQAVKYFFGTNISGPCYMQEIATSNQSIK